jgi:hypothetical protein
MFSILQLKSLAQHHQAASVNVRFAREQDFSDRFYVSHEYSYPDYSCKLKTSQDVADLCVNIYR